MMRSRLLLVLALSLIALCVPGCDRGGSDGDTGSGGEDVTSPQDTVQPEDTLPQDTVQPEDTLPQDTLQPEETLPEDTLEDTLEDRLQPEDNGGGSCGDGVCGDGEDPCTCPDDCLTEEVCCQASDCPQPYCGPCCYVECVDFACTGDLWLDDCCWNGECEEGETPENCPDDCQVPCADDFDCPYKMKCQDGGCVDVGCVEKGGLLPGAISPEYLDHMATECCEGLDQISYAGNYDEDCQFVPLAGGPSGACTECGNGACEEQETKCNCPDDCPSTPCIPEGDAQCDYEDWTMECCPGLVPVSMIPVDEDGQCGIALPCGFVCTRCGDGECGIAENKCNCEEDCPE